MLRSQRGGRSHYCTMPERIETALIPDSRMFEIFVLTVSVIFDKLI